MDMKGSITAAISLVLFGGAPAFAQSADAQHTEIIPNGSPPSFVGAANNFSGTAVVTPLYAATRHTHATGGLVTFAPGARTVWHSHPGGQVLIVIQGVGWAQDEGEAKREIKAGDVVWIPPGVRHWHGASDKTAMSHIAITYMVDGKNVEWMDLVTDEQYRK